MTTKYEIEEKDLEKEKEIDLSKVKIFDTNRHYGIDINTEGIRIEPVTVGWHSSTSITGTELRYETILQPVWNYEDIVEQIPF